MTSRFQIKNIRPSFLWLSMASLSTVFIQSTTAAQSQDQVMDTIVITATRSEKKQSDSPIRTEVISEQELKRTNALTLKDALENVPGILLREIHGKSGYEISLQGLTSDQVLILIDGLPLAASTSSTVDLDQYLVAGIDHIEVIKGAASAQYGSSAMGGVINIISKKVQDGVHISAQIDMGSYAKQNDSSKSTSINNHHEKIQIEASNGTFKGRIIADQLDNKGFAVNPDEYARQGDAQNRQQYALYTAWQPSKDFQIWADFNQYQEQDQQRSLVYITPSYTPQFKDEDIERQRLSAGSQFKLLAHAQVELKAVHETYETDSTQTTDGYLSARRNSQQENNHFSSQFNLAEWHKQNWQFGYDWHEEKLNQTNNGKFEMQGGQVSRDRHEFYMQNDLQLNHKLDMVLGWRFQNDQDFGDHHSFKLSTKYRVIEQDDFLADLRLSLGQGYRAPNLKERFYSFDHSHLGYIVIGNPNLEPESSDSYQLGLSLVESDQWNAEINLFLNKVEDLIQTDYDNASIVNGITQYSYSNINQAKTQGLEASGMYRINPSLSLNAAYTYTDATDESTDRALTRRPKHIARIGTDYTFNDQLDLSLRARYQSDEFSDSANLNRSPAWFSVNGQVDYHLSTLLSAFFGIDNMFNEQRDFSDSADYRPIEGRYIYTGIRFNWGINSK